MILYHKKISVTLPATSLCFSVFKEPDYNGYCMKVRRSSDDATQDIGFVDNMVDIASILSFVGSDDGFVDTWYDQSGDGNHAIQTTKDAQLKIISKGNVYATNRRIMIYGANAKYMRTTNSINLGTLVSFFLIGKQTDISAQYRALVSGNLNYFFFLGTAVDGKTIATLYGGGNGTWDSTVPNSDVDWEYRQRLITSINDGNDNLFINGDAESSENHPMGSYNDKIFINNNFNGLFGEIRIFTTSVLSERSTIESKILENFRLPNYTDHPDTADDFLSITGITDETISDSISTLVSDLINADIWDKLIAVYPFVGGTADTHKYNLKDPRDSNDAYRITFHGTLDHSKLGIYPDGSSGYADTHLIPYGELRPCDQHLAFFSGAFAESVLGESMGVYAAGYTALAIRETNNRIYPQIGGNRALYTTNRQTKGFFIASKTVSNKVSAYIDGSKIMDEQTNADNFEGTYSIFLFSWNTTTGAARFDNKLCKFASIGLGLSATEADDYNTIVQTFQENLGRENDYNTAEDFLDITGITDQTISNAITDLVQDLIDAGIWSKMVAVYPFVGGSADTHKYNLKDPRDTDNAYRLTYHGGLTHASTGVTPNGSTGYAETHLIPDIMPSLFGHCSYYSRTSAAAAAVREMGTYVGGMFGMIIRFTGNLFYSYMGNSTSAANSSTQGFFITSKSAANKVSSYVNTTKIMNEVACNDGVLGTGQCLLFAANYGGSPLGYTTKECAFASFGIGLTASEADAFNTAVQTFQTTLGRNV